MTASTSRTARTLRRTVTARVCALVLAGALVGGLTGCGSDETSSAPSTTEPAIVPVPGDPTPGDQDYSDVPSWDIIKDIPTAQILGRDPETAQRAVAPTGWVIRVVEQDGAELPVTMDFSDRRLNVVVTDGRIVAISYIG